MDATDETPAVKKATRTEENPGNENRTILAKDPVKEFQEYLLDIGIRL